ncbi:8952_t:CDS:2 [Ambispora gerdemannii]|uniref:8952_t:CDS:1 n=1 Tax=Ambispora gerdemannii TaxID=144530 RepID=A0A9N9FA63_9GLOM|nr:8952_t:CDS:2 [Ambispora gerdemannii]
MTGKRGCKREQQYVQPLTSKWTYLASTNDLNSRIYLKMFGKYLLQGVPPAKDTGWMENAVMSHGIPSTKCMT